VFQTVLGLFGYVHVHELRRQAMFYDGTHDVYGGIEREFRHGVLYICM
jgi:hypothetical protein